MSVSAKLGTPYPYTMNPEWTPRNPFSRNLRKLRNLKPDGKPATFKAATFHAETFQSSNPAKLLHGCSRPTLGGRVPPGGVPPFRPYTVQGRSGPGDPKPPFRGALPPFSQLRKRWHLRNGGFGGGNGGKAPENGGSDPEFY